MRRRIALTLALGTRLFAGDWLTFGHDPQRTGWAFEETVLNPQNVPNLKLVWKTKLKNEAYSLSALTAPVVASRISTAKGVRSVVYVAGITGTVFALDAETGEELWNHPFKYVVQPSFAAGRTTNRMTRRSICSPCDGVAPCSWVPLRYPP